MTDYISREDALKMIREKYGHVSVYPICKSLAEIIERVPAANANTVIYGHWDGDDYPTCSQCGRPALSSKENLRVVDKHYEDFSRRVKFYSAVSYDVVYHKTAFCPHCGVKMRARKEE